MRRSLIRAMSPVVATAIVFACGGGGEKKADDSTAAKDSATAAVAATPAPESFSMMGKSPDWSVEVTPTGILFDRKRKGKPDTIQFEYKAPSVNGAIREFTVIRMQPDTHRIDITLAMTKCKVGDTDMEWKATVWVDQKAYNGCANKK